MLIHTPVDLLTVADVARAIRRTPRYVRGLVKAGKLKALRLSDKGNWLITRASLCDLIGFESSEREHSQAYYQQRGEAAMVRLGFGKHRPRGKNRR